MLKTRCSGAVGFPKDAKNVEGFKGEKQGTCLEEKSTTAYHQ